MILGDLHKRLWANLFWYMSSTIYSLHEDYLSNFPQWLTDQKNWYITSNMTSLPNTFILNMFATWDPCMKELLSLTKLNTKLWTSEIDRKLVCTQI